MITKKDISKGAVSNTHISRSAEIDPSKLKGDKIGSILIANRDGKYVARKVRGDAELLPSGEFKISKTAEAGEVTQDEVRKVGGIIGRDIKAGSTLVGERDGTPKEVNVGTGASAIPQRDSSGDLQAENSAKLNSQDGAYYTNPDNHTAGVVGSTTNAGQGLTYATQVKPLKELVADFDYDAQGSGYAGTSLPAITHNFGYIPTCKIYKVSGSNLEEIEMNVVSTTTTTNISFNYINHDLKIILR